MRCEFAYCLYNNRSFCTLPKIEINCVGMCDSLIVTLVPDEYLKEFKQKQLKEIDFENQN